MLLFVTSFILLEIANIESTNPKSVNIALETVLAFDNKDKSANVKFIDDFQNFLFEVKKAVNKKPPQRRNIKTVNNLKFSDFVKNLIDILKNYQDDDLEDVFAVLDDEVRKYHYKGCKFYELISDHNLRRYVANVLNSVKEKPAKEIRKNLDETLQLIDDAKFNSKQTEILDYVNSLYTKEDRLEFEKILRNFQMYQRKSKRVNFHLINLVRDSLRSVAFDHYTSLNKNIRNDLKEKLETFYWKHVNQSYCENLKEFTTECGTGKIHDNNLRENNHKTMPLDKKEFIDVLVEKETAKIYTNDKYKPIYIQKILINDTYAKEMTMNENKHSHDSDRENDGWIGIPVMTDGSDDTDETAASSNEQFLSHKALSKIRKKNIKNIEKPGISDKDYSSSGEHTKNKNGERKSKKHASVDVSSSTETKTTSKSKRHHKHKFNSKLSVQADSEEFSLVKKKRAKLDTTTRESRMHTLWVEKVKHKHLRNKERQKSRSSENIHNELNEKGTKTQAHDDASEVRHHKKGSANLKPYKTKTKNKHTHIVTRKDTIDTDKDMYRTAHKKEKKAKHIKYKIGKENEKTTTDEDNDRGLTTQKMTALYLNPLRTGSKILYDIIKKYTKNKSTNSKQHDLIKETAEDKSYMRQKPKDSTQEEIPSESTKRQKKVNKNTSSKKRKKIGKIADKDEEKIDYTIRRQNLKKRSMKTIKSILPKVQKTVEKSTEVEIYTSKEEDYTSIHKTEEQKPTFKKRTMVKSSSEEYVPIQKSRIMGKSTEKKRDIMPKKSLKIKNIDEISVSRQELEMVDNIATRLPTPNPRAKIIKKPTTTQNKATKPTINEIEETINRNLYMRESQNRQLEILPSYRLTPSDESMSKESEESKKYMSELSNGNNFIKQAKSLLKRIDILEQPGMSRANDDSKKFKSKINDKKSSTIAKSFLKRIDILPQSGMSRDSNEVQKYQSKVNVDKNYANQTKSLLKRIDIIPQTGMSIDSNEVQKYQSKVNVDNTLAKQTNSFLIGIDSFEKSDTSKESNEVETYRSKLNEDNNFTQQAKSLLKRIDISQQGISRDSNEAKIYQSKVNVDNNFAKQTKSIFKGSDSLEIPILSKESIEVIKYQGKTNDANNFTKQATFLIGTDSFENPGMSGESKEVKEYLNKINNAKNLTNQEKAFLKRIDILDKQFMEIESDEFKISRRISNNNFTKKAESLLNQTGLLKKPKTFIESNEMRKYLNKMNDINNFTKHAQSLLKQIDFLDEQGMEMKSGELKEYISKIKDTENRTDQAESFLKRVDFLNKQGTRIENNEEYVTKINIDNNFTSQGDSLSDRIDSLNKRDVLIDSEEVKKRINDVNSDKNVTKQTELLSDHIDFLDKRSVTPESSLRKMNNVDKLTKKEDYFLNRTDLLQKPTEAAEDTTTAKPTSKLEGDVNDTKIVYPILDFWETTTENTVKTKQQIKQTGTTNTTIPNNSSTLKTTTTITKLATDNKTNTVTKITSDFSTKRRIKRRRRRRRKQNSVTSNDMTTEITTLPMKKTIESNQIYKPVALNDKENIAVRSKQEDPVEPMINNDLRLNKENLKFDTDDEGNVKNNLQLIPNENATTVEPHIDDVMQSLMDKYDLVTVATSRNNLEHVSSAIQTTNNDIKSQIKEVESSLRVDKDLMKLYGETVTHFSEKTEPVNTLFTDAFDALDNLDLIL